MRVQTEAQIIMAATAAIGIASVSLMVRAFVLIARSGGWVNAIQRTESGRWSAARWLLLIGALLGVISAAMISWMASLNLSHWPP